MYSFRGLTAIKGNARAMTIKCVRVKSIRGSGLEIYWPTEELDCEKTELKHLNLTYVGEALGLRRACHHFKEDSIHFSGLG